MTDPKTDIEIKAIILFGRVIAIIVFGAGIALHYMGKPQSSFCINTGIGILLACAIFSFFWAFKRRKS